MMPVGTSHQPAEPDMNALIVPLHLAPICRPDSGAGGPSGADMQTKIVVLVVRLCDRDQVALQDSHSNVANGYGRADGNRND